MNRRHEHYARRLARNVSASSASKLDLETFKPVEFEGLLEAVINSYCQICELNGDPQVVASRYLIAPGISVCAEHDAEYDQGASWCSTCAECGLEIINDYLCPHCRQTLDTPSSS